MPEERVVVVSSCTNAKVSLPSDARVSAETLYAGEQHRRLMRGIHVFRRACPAVELDLSIVSAGHGLVDAAALIGSYDATFSGVDAESLTREAGQLGIARNVSLRLSQPYKLGLLLLGTDYLRAARISPSWSLGGPTIAFCSAAWARRLDGIKNLTCVRAGRPEAPRFSCGLVGLKGEMAGRLLEVLARMPGLLDTVGHVSTQKVLHLIDSRYEAGLQIAA